MLQRASSAKLRFVFIKVMDLFLAERCYPSKSEDINLYRSKSTAAGIGLAAGLSIIIGGPMGSDGDAPFVEGATRSVRILLAPISNAVNPTINRQKVSTVYSTPHRMRGKCYELSR